MTFHSVNTSLTGSHVLDIALAALAVAVVVYGIRMGL